MTHELNVPDSVKEKTNRIKQHLITHKTTYLVGSGMLTLGYLLRQSRITTIVISEAAPVDPALSTALDQLEDNVEALFSDEVIKEIEQHGSTMIQFEDGLLVDIIKK